MKINDRPKKPEAQEQKPARRKPITLEDVRKKFTPEELRRFADGARFIHATE